MRRDSIPSPLQEVNDAAFERAVLKSRLPVLVVFQAPWSQPCLETDRWLDGLAFEMEGRVKIARLNITANPRVPDAYGVTAVPTFVLFRDGQPGARLTGPGSPDEVRQLL